MQASSQAAANTSVIRALAAEHFPRAAQLVRESFMRYIAPDWTEQACASFKAEMTEVLLGELAAAGAYAIGAFRGDLMQGVLVMPVPSRLRLLFVDPSCVGQGIGRGLWQQARAHLSEHHPDVQTVELNASPFACRFYLRLGFAPLSCEFEHRGARTTRMACWLPAERLGALPIHAQAADRCAK